MAQDVIIAAWRDFHDVRARTGEGLRAWLDQIAEYGFLDALRHSHQQMRDVRQQVPLPQDSHGGMLVAADTSSPSQQAIRQEEEAVRDEAFVRLTPDDQEIVRLHFWDGLDWPQVAKRMRRSVVAVRRLYYRALKRWKREVESKS